MRKPLVASLADLKSKVQSKIICTNDNIKEIVKREIKQIGNNADLNHLDVSRVTNMGFLFSNSKFNGDISQWDVSNVEDMDNMFYKSDFDQNISNWDVSNVKDMKFMFYKSGFDQDISNWKVDPKCDYSNMFYGCPIRLEYKPKLLK